MNPSSENEIPPVISSRIEILLRTSLSQFQKKICKHLQKIEVVGTFPTESKNEKIKGKEKESSIFIVYITFNISIYLSTFVFLSIYLSICLSIYLCIPIYQPSRRNLIIQKLQISKQRELKGVNRTWSVSRESPGEYLELQGLYRTRSVSRESSRKYF